MKKKQQAIISKILILCMVMTLSVTTLVGMSAVSVSATAVTFEPNYTGTTTIPAGWAGNNFTISQPSWPAFVGSGYGSSAQLIYSGYIWEGAIDYSWKQLNGYNGTAVLYFYYNDENNYYALKMSASGSQIVKKVNGTETILGTDATPLVNIGGDISIRVVRDDGGAITVYRGASTTQATTEVYKSTVADTAAPSGKIGIGFVMGGGHLCGVKVVGNATENGSSTPSPTPLPDNASDVTFEPSYIGISGMPAGWTSNNFSIKDPATWAAFLGSGYGSSAQAIYDGYIWEGSVDYSWKQLNGYNGTTIMYFYYTDSNNYYALEMSASGNQLVKKVNSVETILGSNSTPLVNIGRDVSIRLVRNSDGIIIVYSGSSGSVPTEELFRSTVADSTSPTGKIGMGVTMGGGHLCGLRVVGCAIRDEVQPTATPTASPSPTPSTGPTPPAITFDTTFNPNYSGQQGIPPSPAWSGSGFTLGTWNNYNFTASDGTLLCDQYTWNGALDYSFTQISINSCTSALAYFMYQDANNYYALEITSAGAQIIKVVNGVRTSLGSTTQKLYDNQVSLRVIRQANGHITVWKGDKDSTTQAEYVFESTANDMTFNSGRIGMGYTGRTGSQPYLVSPSVKGITAPIPTPIPLITAVSTTPVAGSTSFNPVNTAVARKLGRAYVMNNVVNITWSLSGLEFNVTNAKEVYAALKGSGTVAILIDDQEEPIHMQVQGTDFANGVYTKIASFAAEGNHKIRILKESDMNSSIAISDIKVEGNTPNAFATAERRRKIEFVGDSITVGACMFPSGSANERMGTNAILNYAGQTGLYFGADLSMAAVSGSGFAVDVKDTMSTYFYYDYVIQPKSALISDDYKWNFSQYRPDIVIVNIGTNGGTDNTKDKYIQFYNQIRARYNDANNKIAILFALGAINQTAWPNLDAAYQELRKTDNNVYELQLGTGYTAGVAAHPDLAQQTRMAKTLIAYLKEIMPGWGGAEISAGAYQQSGNTVTVPYRVLNKVDASTTNIVMAGLYDSKGRLVAVTMKDISFDADNTSVNQTVTFSGSKLSATEPYTVKLFLWKDKQTLVPLSMVERVTLH